MHEGELFVELLQGRSDLPAPGSPPFGSLPLAPLLCCKSCLPNSCWEPKVPLENRSLKGTEIHPPVEPRELLPLYWCWKRIPTLLKTPALWSV